MLTVMAVPAAALLLTSKRSMVMPAGSRAVTLKKLPPLTTALVVVPAKPVVRSMAEAVEPAARTMAAATRMVLGIGRSPEQKRKWTGDARRNLAPSYQRTGDPQWQ